MTNPHAEFTQYLATARASARAVADATPEYAQIAWNAVAVLERAATVTTGHDYSEGKTVKRKAEAADDPPGDRMPKRKALTSRPSAPTQRKKEKRPDADADTDARTSNPPVPPPPMEPTYASSTTPSSAPVPANDTDIEATIRKLQKSAKLLLLSSNPPDRCFVHVLHVFESVAKLQDKTDLVFTSLPDASRRKVKRSLTTIRDQAQYWTKECSKTDDDLIASLQHDRDQDQLKDIPMFKQLLLHNLGGIIHFITTELEKLDHA